MNNDVSPRWRPREWDWIAVSVVGVLLAALVAGGVWLHARHIAEREARTRSAAAARQAAQAAAPKRLPPITTSVYVRAVPVRRAR